MKTENKNRDQKCMDGYITPLTKIINKSISQGILPSKVKLARVIPIFKSNNQQNKFMEHNKIINENQFGFCKGLGTLHAIISLMDNISKSVNRGDIEINMFLGYKNAFDTDSHSILLGKLSADSIKGNLLKLCKYGLTDRY